MKKNHLKIIALSILFANSALANVDLSIYNNNLALIKDSRTIAIKQGSQKIAFKDVSANLNPQSAFLLADDIKVIEKNYNYNLINQENMLNYFINKEVKTVITNQETGKDVIKTATVLANNYGTPVLKFDYGIETNFNGRIIFDTIPQSLTATPLFEFVVDSPKAQDKDIDLLYLTSGLSWQADYIAEVKNKDTLNLNAWATITNNSGTDFNDAKIKVVAGDISAQSSIMPQTLMARAKGMYSNSMEESFAPDVSAQNLGDFHFYDIDAKTTIKNKQSKQVSLFAKQNVAYTKSYRFSSPLYIGKGLSTTEFKDANPEVIFNIKNDQASNLNMLLPSGKIRFYENDSFGNMIFVGENNIKQTSALQNIEIGIGKTSDFYATGKILSVDQVSKEAIDIDMEVSFYNTKPSQEEVVFEQSFGGKWNIVKENIKSSIKNTSTVNWAFKIPANGKFILKYKVRVEN